MHDSERWKKALEDQGWTDAFSPATSSGTTSDDESERVEGVMSELGLA